MKTTKTIIEPWEVSVTTSRKNFVKIVHDPSGIAVTKHNSKSQQAAYAEAAEELTMLVELWESEGNK